MKGITHELRAGEEATITNVETGARVWFYAVARQRIVVPYGFRLETCANPSPGTEGNSSACQSDPCRPSRTRGKGAS
jgi:hypothetical protein